MELVCRPSGLSTSMIEISDTKLLIAKLQLLSVFLQGAMSSFRCSANQGNAPILNDIDVCR